MMMLSLEAVNRISVILKCIMGLPCTIDGIHGCQAVAHAHRKSSLLIVVAFA
jgi:hypothetical protein